MKKNERKTASRRRHGVGHRDLERHPTEFGPPKGKANFYGNFSPSRARRLRATALRIKAAAEGGDAATRDRLVDRLPEWMRRVFRGVSE